MMQHIAKVEVIGSHRLRFIFVEGGAREMDFTPLIHRGGVWSDLADPKMFAGVKLGEHGRYVEWSGGQDFCADAAWAEGQEPADSRDHETASR